MNIWWYLYLVPAVFSIVASIYGTVWIDEDDLTVKELTAMVSLAVIPVFNIVVSVGICAWYLDKFARASVMERVVIKGRKR